MIHPVPGDLIRHKPRGTTYLVREECQVKWADGKWYKAVIYMPHINIPPALPVYVRRLEDFDSDWEKEN